ncbi:SRPBCC family protein [Myroides phaeus]|uniref:Polyketide cyclase / dehydrase and lipid transport n=1 Tax=Myroides phaeus TaxID=702745 RepID=A0A1G8D7Y1_9FLAO|nr:hypothetical protein [Myroides phaeus]SDH53825.1 hypothetical protein SAMN05421818_10643 [Myroides phaeus]
MKILKYFFLLFALGLVSLFVFILTQNPEYKVERNFTVDAPKQVVYEYISNLDNWTDWMKSEKVGNGIYDIELEKLGKYTIRPEYTHPYDSLSQDILHDATISNIKWKLDRKQGKTNVSFSFSGSLDLKTKIITFFSGTPNQVATNSIDKNINAFIVYFIKQYKDYTVTIGDVQKSTPTNYVYVEHLSSLGSLNDDLVAINKELEQFCKDNKLTKTGDPFLLLSEEKSRETINYKFAIPIKENIFLNEEERFKMASIESCDYFESTLTGYYTFLPEAVQQTRTAIANQEMQIQPDEPFVLVLRNSVIDSRLASEWKTVIKIAIIKKEVPVVPTYHYGTSYSGGTKRDSITTAITPATTTTVTHPINTTPVVPVTPPTEE